MNIMICNTGINQLHLPKDISDKFPTTFIITNHISELEKCSVASVSLFTCISALIHYKGTLTA